MRQHTALFVCLITSSTASKSKKINDAFPLKAIRTIDGTDGHPEGRAGAMLLRISPVDYPGVGSGIEIKQPPAVPNARTVSNAISDQTSDMPNRAGMTSMVWAWGQLLDHDISLTEPHATFGTVNVMIENIFDPLHVGAFIPFDRSEYNHETGTSTNNPRQQVNNITAYIDASNVYGSDSYRETALRTFTDGLLKSTIINGHELLPYNEDGLHNAGSMSPALFLAGDIRANEHVGLQSMHTLFLREHNRLARKIKKLYEDATDENIYQLARKIVGAEMQVITYNEFLPILLGPMAPSLKDYKGFNETVNPCIANEFSTSAFRFGHTMLPADLLMADDKGLTGSIGLRDAFFNMRFITENPQNIDLLLGGFRMSPAQEIDTRIIDDVRNFLFGRPGAGALDLVSLNIQRGRDHGLPSYNSVRVSYGLEPATAFDQVTSNRDLQARLASVYAAPNDIDVWVGGLAEDHIPGGNVGMLLASILREQFTRLMDGDPFFYLNDQDLWTKDVRKIIRLDKLLLSDLIRYNTRLRIEKNASYFQVGERRVKRGRRGSKHDNSESQSHFASDRKKQKKTRSNTN